MQTKYNIIDSNMKYNLQKLCVCVCTNSNIYSIENLVQQSNLI